MSSMKCVSKCPMFFETKNGHDVLIMSGQRQLGSGDREFLTMSKVCPVIELTFLNVLC